MAKKLILNCRTCAKKISSCDLIPIFREIEIKKFPIDVIKDFHTTNFKIFENDGLSQYICYNCLEYFVKFVKFIKQCENSQIILQKQLKNNCNNNNNNIQNIKEDTVNILKFVGNHQNEDLLENKKIEEYLEFENNDDVDNNSECSNNNDILIDNDFIDNEFNINEILEFNKNINSLKEWNNIILCELCGLEFHKNNLKIHLESIEHLGTKQYSCEFCEKYSLQDAYHIYQEMCEKYQPTPLLLNGQAVCHIGQERYEEAEAALKEALSKKHNDFDTLINLVVVSHLTGKTPEVLNRYIEQIKQFYPNSEFVTDYNQKDEEFDRLCEQYKPELVV